MVEFLLLTSHDRKAFETMVASAGAAGFQLLFPVQVVEHEYDVASALDPAHVETKRGPVFYLSAIRVPGGK